MQPGMPTGPMSMARMTRRMGAGMVARDHNSITSRTSATGALVACSGVRLAHARGVLLLCVHGGMHVYRAFSGSRILPDCRTH